MPPERALFRELVFTTVGRTIESYTVGGYRITASAIKLIAWGLFARMNNAGVVIDDNGRPFSRDALAKDASASTRVVRAALTYLQQARLIAIDPARGRQRAVIRINLAGLDWSSVRRRVKITIAARNTVTELPPANAQEPLPLLDKGDDSSPLQRRRVDESSPLEGYVRGGQSSESIAAASTSRASLVDRRQQQQQKRNQVRIEGLFGAIASRCREMGYDYDEQDERRRLREGEIGLNRLQAHADRLAIEVREKRLRRAYGSRYRG